MTLTNLYHLETDIEEVADQFSTNSKLTATEYSIPVLGLTFEGREDSGQAIVVVMDALEDEMPLLAGVLQYI